MRINILIGPFHPIPPTRGLAVERRQFAMAHAYARRGHQVTMISRRFEDRAHDEIAEGVRHIRVQSSDSPAGRASARLRDIAYILRARRAMPPADVTVTNSVSAPLLIPPAAGLIHVSVGRYPKGQMGLYRRAARLLAPSHAVAAAIRRQSPSMASRVRVIPNPIGDGFAEAAERLIAGEWSPPRERELVYVGRIAREKGVHLLIDAFRRLAPGHPEWRLSIIGPTEAASGGDGEAYRRALIQAAGPLGSRIRLEGPIYRPAALISRLRRAGVFVYPSVAEKGESFGVAPVEAMACGCPVVVSGLECFGEFVTPDVTGLAFDHRTDAVGNLAAACAVLMASPARREALGGAALLASRRFFPEAVADVMLQDFEALMALRARPERRSGDGRAARH